MYVEHSWCQGFQKYFESCCMWLVSGFDLPLFGTYGYTVVSSLGLCFALGMYVLAGLITELFSSPKDASWSACSTSSFLFSFSNILTFSFN